MIVNIDPMVVNDDASPNLFNSRFKAITDAINGKLGPENIRNGSLTREVLALDALSAAWPINSVYISVVNENPSTKLGGTWVAFGSGRTLVGVDTNQDEFNSVEKQGGEKEVTLTNDQLPAHNHSIVNNTEGWVSAASGVAPSGFALSTNNTYTAKRRIYTDNSGGGQAHGNLQPYITVYFWKRTS